MAVQNKSIDKLLGATRVGFTNTRDCAEVKEKVTNFGYTDERLTGLLDLRTQLEEKYHEQQRQRGIQTVVYRDFEDKYAAERTHYWDIRGLARKVIKRGDNEKRYRLLGLDERTRNGFDNFLTASHKLYSNAMRDPKVMELLALFQITAEKLQERLDACEELKLLNNERKIAQGMAQVLRQERDQLYSQLRDQWQDFKDVCKIAFRGTPTEQFKELAGIIAYSPGYTKPKPAPVAEEPTDPAAPADPVPPADPTDPIVPQA